MKTRIGILQMEVAFGQPEKNQEKAQELISRVVEQGVDSVALPEMWNVGFFPENVRELADEEGETTKGLLKEWSQKWGVNIFGGSVATKKGDGLCNTAYIFDARGNMVGEYDKIHLFTFAGEHNYFQQGKETVVFELDGVRYGQIICYDLRFPELLRHLALDGAQVILAPAQWPLKRKEHWRTLLRARAIENQLYAIGINASGETPKGLTWGGHSACIDPWGNYLVEGGTGEEILVAEIDLDQVLEIRNTINVFQDRCPQLFNLMRQEVQT